MHFFLLGGPIEGCTREVLEESLRVHRQLAHIVDIQHHPLDKAGCFAVKRRSYSDLHAGSGLCLDRLTLLESTRILHRFSNLLLLSYMSSAAGRTQRPSSQGQEQEARII